LHNAAQPPKSAPPTKQHDSRHFSDLERSGTTLAEGVVVKASYLLTALGAALATALVGAPAHAGAWVYKDCSFSGTAKYLPNGTYTLAQLNAAGVLNDDVSSIAIDAGTRVQMFENDNFGGSWDWLYGNRSCLVNNRKVNGGNWNDQVSSLKLEGYSGAGISANYLRHQYWNGNSWSTDFEDDFNGTSLNTANWQVHDSYWHGTFNGEKQCYVNEQGVNDNYWLGAGELNILVQKENRNCGGTTMNYSSARLITKNRKEFAQGAWEAQLEFFKSDNAQGIWPAFWALQEPINEQPDPGWACWPQNGAREVDIWEYSTNTAWAGLPSWDSHITNFIRDGGGCQNAIHNRVDVTGVNPYNMHTYRVEFWGGYLKIFVDGTFRREFPQGDWDDYSWFALFNVAVGGGLGGPTFGW
jgi:beta-glucanase (GH16 family)